MTWEVSTETNDREIVVCLMDAQQQRSIYLRFPRESRSLFPPYKVEYLHQGNVYETEYF